MLVAHISDITKCYICGFILLGPIPQLLQNHDLSSLLCQTYFLCQEEVCKLAVGSSC